jgi:ankyrin repeat protein
MKHDLNKWHKAARDGNLDLIKQMIRDSINVNVTGFFDFFEKNALHLASENAHLDIVKVLIEAGADLNIKDNDGFTALHWVSRKGHLTIVKVLIESGADLNIRNKYGDTALHYVSKSNFIEIIKQLVEAGAKLDQLTIKKYGDQLAKEIVDNIKMNNDWQRIQYLFPDQQLEFPEHLRVASQMGLYS